MVKKKSASTIGNDLRAKGAKKVQRRTEPFWKGPEVDGITQSLLNDYLACPERFRVKVIEGLAPDEGFNHRLEYGHMWHLCEEYHARKQSYDAPLLDYVQSLCKKHPLARDDIQRWYNVCLKQFPEYVKYWKKHKDELKRKPMFQECTFKVPLSLPSGRYVWLKGKWDQVDIIDGKMWLKENKTKGEINELKLARQLTFDLQTMFYLVALGSLQSIINEGVDDFPLENLSEELLPEGEWAGNMKGWDCPIAGVRYNVIRRPLSGGKGSIRQHQPTKSNPQGESLADYYERLRRDYIAAEPEYWFMRWDVPVTDKDLDRFTNEFLYPVLEQLCDWYDHVSRSLKLGISAFGYTGATAHYRLPFGIYNPLAEAGFTEMDEFLDNGSQVGLKPIESLFPELEEIEA